MRRSANSGLIRGVFASAILTLGLALLPTLAIAQQAASTDDILKALKPKLTRGLVIGAPAVAKVDPGFVSALRSKASRGITVTERAKIAVIATQRPQINLEIPFDFDSAAISPAAVPQLVRLGQALQDKDLQTATFLVAGHTDGKGAADYNQQLSERRAAAVRQFLVEQYGLNAQYLIAIGYGFEQLKNTYDPLAAENRRVQIVNLADR